MASDQKQTALRLVDDFVADGKSSFSFIEAVERTGRSTTATANLLRRMADQGLIDKVKRGHYVIRRLGVLGTSAASEDLALATGAAFSGLDHRIAYRSALDEHDLLAHPARTIQVACVQRVRTASLSGRPLKVILEPVDTILVGAEPRSESWVSDLQRALLDAAARPELAGGAAVLAEALATAGNRTDVELLQSYAEQISWSAALRRLGSIADRLEFEGLAGHLRPVIEPRGDIDLEPRARGDVAWRDAHWRVRWRQDPGELNQVARQ